jgi:hypothetical protein
VHRNLPSQSKRTPTSLESITVTFADDTAVLATDSDPAITETANQPSRNPNLVKKKNGEKS